MSSDDGDNASDALPVDAADFRSHAVFKSMMLLFGMAVLGAVGIYAINILPWLAFSSRSQNYWPLQAYVFAGCGMLSFSTVLSCRIVDRFTRRSSSLALGWRIAIGGIAIMAAIAFTLAFAVLPMYLFFAGIPWGNPLPMWFITSILAQTWYAALLMNREVSAQRDQALQIKLNTDALETALDRAELSMLEAQIEPHFLFNTLAHVKRHFRVNDVVTADRMLAALLDYLKRAMPALRRDDWTVGDELSLIRAYLEILTERFETRLRFVITAPDDALRAHVPALTVATLVENSVRHGIAPQIEGGTVRVAIEVDAATLRIEVCDDGVGLKVATGSGLGLVTIRARLQNAFGTNVGFTVEPLDAKGVKATITIPLRTS